MKLSFSTLSCPDWPWEKVLDEAQRLGYAGIEARGADGEMYLPNARPFQPENIARTMEELRTRSLVVTDLGSSVSFHDPAMWASSLQEGKDYVDLAAKLGVPYVRVFGDKVPDLSKADETIALIVKGYRELCAYIGDRNVMILQETHGDFADIELLRPVFEGVGHPKLGLLWDIEHVFRRYGTDASAFAAWAAPYVRHVHVKDAKRQPDGRFTLCMIGEGDVPVAADVALLRGIGYSGFLSLEWEKKWVPHLEEPEVVIPLYPAFMNRILAGREGEYAIRAMP
jgi:sugar phosphate isomerase/epimerase